MRILSECRYPGIFWYTLRVDVIESLVTMHVFILSCGLQRTQINVRWWHDKLRPGCKPLLIDILWPGEMVDSGL